MKQTVWGIIRRHKKSALLNFPASFKLSLQSHFTSKLSDLLNFVELYKIKLTQSLVLDGYLNIVQINNNK